MSNYKIKSTQNKYLGKLKCQRLTKGSDNDHPVAVFENTVNPNLPEAMQEAWKSIQEDKDKGDIAYYIIKDENNEPLLFFSLKCGELHQPLSYHKVLEQYTNALTIYNTLRTGRGPKWAVDDLKSRMVDGALPDAEIEKIHRNLTYRKKEYFASEDEKRSESSTRIYQAKKVYSGVELVHFCKHEPADEAWYAAGMTRSMGKTLFCHFIVPKIQQISELVGCEYVYLFAADSSDDKGLIKLYKDLSFFEPKYIGSTKPLYDFGCKFMCQQLVRLDRMKRSFFYNYNKPKEQAKEAPKAE